MLGKIFHPHLFCSAIILAAGSSERMGGIDKITADLAGKMVLVRTLEAFSNCELVDEIVVVTRENAMEKVASICASLNMPKISKVVAGGASRAESALIGCQEVKKKAKLIAIHDGARPLVSQQVIVSAIEAARTKKAVAPAIPVRDTIKIAVSAKVVETPDRRDLFCIQTPQVFSSDLIKGALTNAVNKSLFITDDCQACELLGLPVYLSEGSEYNLKITTPLDLKLAECIIYSQEEKA